MSLQNINSYTYSPGFQLGQYHNAVLCISGNVINLYLDGNLVATQTNASNVLTNYSTINQILIGCAGNKSCGFSGYLDDFRMYNYTLNSAQVSNLYINRNIVAYYPFDNSLNGLTPNYTTLNYDAKLIGAANISSTTGNYKIGTGALSLTNTASLAATSYVTSTSGFSTSATNGLSISLWFKTDGVSGRRMRIFDLCAATGTQGLYVDINGTNQFITNYINNTSTSTATPPIGYTNLKAYFPLTSVNASNYSPNYATETPLYTFLVPAGSITTTPGSYPTFFNGTTSLRVTNNNSYLITIPNPTNTYTCSVWFYLTSYTQYNGILSCGTTDGVDSGCIMSKNPSSASRKIQLYPTNAVLTNDISLNIWHFLSWSVSNVSSTDSSVTALLQTYGSTTPTYSGTAQAPGLTTAPNYFRLGQQIGAASTSYTSSGNFCNFQYYNTPYTLTQMQNLFTSNYTS